MSSLAFADEHLAWKQRVGKEVNKSFTEDKTESVRRNSLSGTKRFFDLSKHSSYKFSSLKDPASEMFHSTIKSFQQMSPIAFKRHVKKFAPKTKQNPDPKRHLQDQYRDFPARFVDTVKESRGKCKPMTWNHHEERKTTAAMFTPKAPNLVYRPNTAGSYQRLSREGARPVLADQERRVTPSGRVKSVNRAYSREQPEYRTPNNRYRTVYRDSRQQDVDSVSEIVSDPRFKRFVTSQPEPKFIRSAEQQEALKEKTVKPKLEPAKVDRPKTPDEPAAEDDLQSEHGEAEDKVEDLPEANDDQAVARPQTAGSWQTTSSQMAYIQKLEDMVKREQARRLEAEKEVKHLKRS